MYEKELGRGIHWSRRSVEKGVTSDHFENGVVWSQLFAISDILPRVTVLLLWLCIVTIFIRCSIAPDSCEISLGRTFL